MNYYHQLLKLAKHRPLFLLVLLVWSLLFISLHVGATSADNATSENGVFANNNLASIQLEIDLKTQTGEYHAPYVAAWVVNSERKSVRTLLLWCKEAKWLKDIRRWWRNVGRKDSDLVDAITSATHIAGRYPLSFAATDDNGKALPDGKYTLYVEVVREKGGRAIVKQKFNLNKKAQRYQIKETPETGEMLLRLTPAT